LYEQMRAGQRSTEKFLPTWSEPSVASLGMTDTVAFGEL